jgi:hypothetical protein
MAIYDRLTIIIYQCFARQIVRTLELGDIAVVAFSWPCDEMGRLCGGCIRRVWLRYNPCCGTHDDGFNAKTGVRTAGLV